MRLLLQSIVSLASQWRREDNYFHGKSTVEKKTCGRRNNHKLSRKKLLSRPEQEKVNNNLRLW
ncbi:hypothetical protein BRARA_A01504 [Brassica rapa]|uniref:Uncharacterized protein n=1 Tax=Brassica campestris TaxID=3711 RepID=A0A398AP72_BRACM|nr:hypothetical protein BRARA_A01504 [Brassica rapa]